MRKESRFPFYEADSPPVNGVYYSDHDQWDGYQHGPSFLAFYSIIYGDENIQFMLCCLSTVTRE